MLFPDFEVTLLCIVIYSCSKCDRVILCACSYYILLCIPFFSIVDWQSLAIHFCELVVKSLRDAVVQSGPEAFYFLLIEINIRMSFHLCIIVEISAYKQDVFNYYGEISA